MLTVMLFYLYKALTLLNKHFNAGLDVDVEARISLAVSTGRLDLSDCGMSSFSFALQFDVCFESCQFQSFVSGALPILYMVPLQLVTRIVPDHVLDT